MIARLLQIWSFFRQPATPDESDLFQLNEELILSAERCARPGRVPMVTRWMNPDLAIVTTTSPLREGEWLYLYLPLGEGGLARIPARVHWTTVTRSGRRVGRLELSTPARHRESLTTFLLERSDQ